MASAKFVFGLMFAISGSGVVLAMANERYWTALALLCAFWSFAFILSKLTRSHS